MKVNIYIEVEHKGNPRGQGKAIGVIEYKSSTGKVYTREVTAESDGETKNALALSIITVALKILLKPCEVTLHTDNEYIKNCVQQGWLESWQQAGWIKANKKAPANLTLWKSLYVCVKLHKVRFAPYEERPEFRKEVQND